jgi:hypothetical protein
MRGKSDLYCLQQSAVQLRSGQRHCAGSTQKSPPPEASGTATVGGGAPADAADGEDKVGTEYAGDGSGVESVGGAMICGAGVGVGVDLTCAEAMVAKATTRPETSTAQKTFSLEMAGTRMNIE